MGNDAYSTFKQFQREILRGPGGPFNSPVEEIADELFQSTISEDSESLWDKRDDD